MISDDCWLNSCRAIPSTTKAGVGWRKKERNHEFSFENVDF